MDLFLLLLPAGLYGTAIVAITAYTGARQTGSDGDYFLAGRGVGAALAFVSVIATETSVATILVFPQAGYAGGLALIWLCLGYIAGRYLVARYYLATLYERHQLSIYETISGGDPAATRALSAVYLCAKFLASGVRFYMGGYALHALFGQSIPFWLLVMAAVAGLYSLSGGIQAVILLDQLQGFVIFLGAAILIALLSGGVDWANVAAPAWYNLKPAWTNAEFSPLLFLGGLVLSIGTHGADQDMLQRVLVARNLSQASRALVYSALGASVVIVSYLFCGWLLKQNGFPEVGDKTPLIDYILTRNSPFLSGAFAMILLATGMSALDSTVHSTGAVWKAALKIELPGRIYSALSLAALFLVALAGIYFETNARSFLDLAMGAFNYIHGGMIGLFTVFTFGKRALRLPVVLAGVFAGLAVTVIANHILPVKPGWTLTLLASASLATLAAWLAARGGAALAAQSAKTAASTASTSASDSNK